jgi:hypothetical protein
MGEPTPHGERPPPRQAPPSASTVPDPGARGTSGWVVGIAVAALLLIVLGTFHVAQGLAALLTDQQLLLGGRETRLEVDTTVWGWVHLLLGVLVLVAGFLVFAGRRWARGVGVTVALLSAVGSLSLLPDHVVWVVAVVALDALVIASLTVHGSEIRAGD